MRTAILPSLSAALVLLSATLAAAATVDRMTCAAAQRQALTTGRFEKMTGFGSTEIFGFWPNDGGPNRCPIGYFQSWYVERTLDNPRCPIAYTCTENIRIR